MPIFDGLLCEAGWEVGGNAAVEVPVTGMPNAKGEGFVDYVLWGADGQPLAVVEAKRSLKDPDVGQQQARLYADCLEQMKGQRPLIFYSRSEEHTSELQSLMRNSYAVFCLKKKKQTNRKQKI